MPDEAKPAPKGLKTAGVAALVIAAGVVAIGVIDRSHQAAEAQVWSDARAIPVVHLVPVRAGGAADALTLPGTLQAWNAAKLYARVGGYLKAWYKDIGAEVGAGTPLGTVDTPELDQQIVQARADLASARANAGLAKSTAARWNDLLKDDSVSRQDADEKNGEAAVRNAAVQAAEAKLGQLMAMKGFATLRAPFAGVVTTRSADIGDLVGPGSGAQAPIFAIADLHRIRTYVSVPQSYSAAMKPGLGATLSVPAFPGRTFRATVIGASGAVNSQTGAFQVQLAGDNPGGVLKPGGYAQVSFDVPGQAGTVQIPSSALIFRAAGTQVAMVDADRRIVLRKVAIGRDLGQTVEVLSGLSPRDRIVDNPPDSLANGELVRVQAGSRG